MNNKKKRIKKQKRKLYNEINKCPKCKKKYVRAYLKEHKMCGDCLDKKRYEDGITIEVSEEKMEELKYILDIMNKGTKEAGLNN